MGGNVTAVIKLTGVETKAEKINIKEFGRKEFVNKFIQIFKAMNKQFEAIYNKPIWVNENHLTSGFAFNGSTSFIMDNSISDEDVIKYKPCVGDIDIIVSEELKNELWYYLSSIEGKEIIPGAYYMGSNKPTINSIGEQINSVIIIELNNGQRINCQIDFEFLEFKDNKPTEWSKFSHGSAFIDTKVGIKAVHHKYLIRALVGGASIREDIIIATNSSTQNNIKPSSNKIHELPRMLKFSVGHGIRVAYEPMFDDNGKIIVMNGKEIYKEIPQKNSTYETNITEIYKLAFHQFDACENDVKLFHSFVGVIELMKKFLNPKQIKETYDRYLNLLWGLTPQRAQELERGDAEMDLQVKYSGYAYCNKELCINETNTKLLIDEYYKNYAS